MSYILLCIFAPFITTGILLAGVYITCQYDALKIAKLKINKLK